MHSTVENNVQPGKLMNTNGSKELVVWGSNLNSGVGKGRITKLVGAMFDLAPYQYSVVIGLLLSALKRTLNL